MPLDATRGGLAAVAITALFWWTVLSPLGLIAAAFVPERRPRLRAVVTLVVVTPPLVVSMPVAVLHGGPGAVVAAAAVALLAAALALAAAALAFADRRPPRARWDLGAALVTGVAGGMVASGALLGALIF